MMQRRWKWGDRYRWLLFGLALLLLLISSHSPSNGQAVSDAARPAEVMPALTAHPLPPSLAQWQDATSSGDYFDQIQTTPAGYLIWSKFPIQIFIEPLPTEPFQGTAGERQRAQQWLVAVRQAIEEWQVYLPLAIAPSPEGANIAIWRTTPPSQLSVNASETRTLESRPRARTAETRYEFFVDRPPEQPATLSHRFTIQLSPNQIPKYVLATARHELGHALGIWGHSPLETDALYFSQVRNPPPISPRDVNTLKRIYEQPTRLGWSVVAPQAGEPATRLDRHRD